MNQLFGLLAFVFATSASAHAGQVVCRSNEVVDGYEHFKITLTQGWETGVTLGAIVIVEWKYKDGSHSKNECIVKNMADHDSQFNIRCDGHRYVQPVAVYQRTETAEAQLTGDAFIRFKCKENDVPPRCNDSAELF